MTAMSTVVSDTTVTYPDGSTAETIVYSDGSQSVQFTPAVGTPAANQATLQQQARTALVNNRTAIAATKPGTAALQASAAYDNSVLALRELTGVIRLLLNQLDATN